MNPLKKILTHEQVDEVLNRWRGLNMRPGDPYRKIGFTCGTFDLLHAGHVHYLTAARQHCGLLICAVNTDESVQRYKGHAPLVPYEQRAYVVAGLNAVNVVTPLDMDRPLPLLKRWHPDLYIKGGDYTPGSIRSAEAVQADGGEVIIIAPRFDISSTQLKQKCIQS